MAALKVNTIWVLVKRELRSTIYGVGIYVAIFFSLIISAFIIENYLEAIIRDQMLISSNPLSYPLFIATTVFAIYLALTSVTSIAREKDMQTMEVLFYSPIDHTTYILSKYFKGLLSYIFMIPFLIIYFTMASVMSNFGLSGDFLRVILLSLFISSCVISFGIFISTLTENVRTSVLLFMGIVGGLIVIQVAHNMLLKMHVANLSSPIINLKYTVSIIHNSVKWASPFYYLSQGIEAVSIGSATKYTLSAVFSMIYSFIALFFAILIITKKGVRKTTGE